MSFWTDEAALKEAIFTGAEMIRARMPWGDPIALLGALAELESSFGQANRPRYERAYDLGGRYCIGDQDRRVHQFGCLAAASVGSFQIMYPTACELGFGGNPLDLCDDRIGVLWVVEYFKQRFVDRGGSTLDQFADCYNSGSHRDRIVPDQYLQKFRMSYPGVVARRKLVKGGEND